MATRVSVDEQYVCVYTAEETMNNSIDEGSGEVYVDVNRLFENTPEFCYIRMHTADYEDRQRRDGAPEHFRLPRDIHLPRYERQQRHRVYAVDPAEQVDPVRIEGQLRPLRIYDEEVEPQICPFCEEGKLYENKDNFICNICAKKYTPTEVAAKNGEALREHHNRTMERAVNTLTIAGTTAGISL